MLPTVTGDSETEKTPENCTVTHGTVDNSNEQCAVVKTNDENVGNKFVGNNTDDKGNSESNVERAEAKTNEKNDDKKCITDNAEDKSTENSSEEKSNKNSIKDKPNEERAVNTKIEDAAIENTSYKPMAKGVSSKANTTSKHEIEPETTSVIAVSKVKEYKSTKTEDDVNTQNKKSVSSASIQTDFLTIVQKERLLYHCPHCPALFLALADLNDHMGFQGKSWQMEHHIHNPDSPRAPLPPNVLFSTQVTRKRDSEDNSANCNENNANVENPAPVVDAAEYAMESYQDNDDNYSFESQKDGPTLRKRRKKKKDPSYEPPAVVKVPPAPRRQGLRERARKRYVKDSTSDTSDSDTDEEEEEEESSDEERPPLVDVSDLDGPEMSADSESVEQVQEKRQIVVRNLPLENTPSVAYDSVGKAKQSNEKRVMESLQKNHLMRLGLTLENNISNLMIPELVHPAISRLRNRVISEVNRKNLQAIECVQKMYSKVQSLKEREMNPGRIIYRPILPTPPPRHRFIAPNTTQVFFRTVAPEANNPATQGPRKQGPLLLRAITQTQQNREWIPQIVSNNGDSSQVVLRAMPKGSTVAQMATSTSNGPIILRPVTSTTSGNTWMPKIVTTSSPSGPIIYKAFPQPSPTGNPSNSPFILTPVSSASSCEWVPKIVQTTSQTPVKRPRTKRTPAEWLPKVGDSKSLRTAPAASRVDGEVLPSLNIDLSCLAERN